MKEKILVFIALSSTGSIFSHGGSGWGAFGGAFAGSAIGGLLVSGASSHSERQANRAEADAAAEEAAYWREKRRQLRMQEQATQAPKNKKAHVSKQIVEEPEEDTEQEENSPLS